MTKKENLLIGVAICTVGYFFSALVGVCSKLASERVSIPVILFFQSLLCLCFLLPEVWARGWSSLKTKRIGLHFVRDFTSLASFLCLFAALITVPLVNAMLLSYTEPLWIPFISIVWPGVQMRGYIWWGIVIGFIGVIMILQPSGEGFSFGAILAIASGVISAVTLIAIHRLSSTEPTHRTLFYNSLFGTVVTAPFFFHSFGSIPFVAFFPLIGAGLFTYASLFLITHSFRHGNPTTLGYFAYTVIPFSGLLGWLFWKEEPNVVSLIGMALVVLGGLFAVYFEKRYQKQI